MNLSHILHRSSIYGPGERFVLWTQGCSIHCPGCWNRDTWDFKPKQERSTGEILTMIQAEASHIEGVTILGGEPFDQYDALLDLAKAIQPTRLSLLVYSGYTLQQLQQTGKDTILPYLDILIDGPYRAHQRNTNLTWRGSSNQTIRIISPRYQALQIEEAKQMEIVLNSDGSFTAYGYPDEFRL